MARRRAARLSGGDRAAVTLMVGVPLFVVVGLVWVPTVLSGVLSFPSWDGIGGISTIEWVGTRNYQQIFEIYPPFWPAFRHNIIWLVFLTLVPTVLGLLLAYLLDKKIRGTRVYQSIFFLPVVLSLAVVGFIWQLVYAPEQGLINNALGRTEQGQVIDWLGNPDLNLWAVLVAAAWRHAGYIMVLYLAGLAGTDPSLADAGAVDGAGPWQRFRYITWPQLRGVNTVVFAVTVIDAVRTFDIVWAMTSGGPYHSTELLSTYMFQQGFTFLNLGYASALAVIIFALALVFIITYLVRAFRQEVH
jgi:multiple sugar transport system permease protein